MGTLRSDADPLGMSAGQDHGYAESVRYVAQTFLGQDQYKKLHEALSVKWDRLHSLSAAVRLMQSYGVDLTDDELAALTDKSEAEQINELVSKIPPQSNDQFQQFFLQLQLLVSTAMRVRRALEDGRPEDVAEALDDADATGIATYILRVAVVQAGNEVSTLRHQFDDWIKQADTKMGRLVRGQQDAVAAQKKLAVAQAELSKHSEVMNAKAMRVVMAFAQDCTKALKTTFFNGWAQAAKTSAIEKKVYEEYRARIEDLEDNLTRIQAEQISNGTNMMLKRVQEDQANLLGDVWSIWRRQAEETKFMRESGEKVKALEEKLNNSKAAQREGAKKVLSSFCAASEQGLKEMCLKSWLEVKKEADLEREAEKAKTACQDRMEEFTKNKSESAKQLLQVFGATTETGLLSQCIQGWARITEDIRRENYLLECLNDKQSSLTSLATRNKVSAGSALAKAASSIDQMMVLRILFSWRNHARTEFTMRRHHVMVDAKRQQLVGVQQMFRDFAKQLEAGVKAQAQMAQDAAAGGGSTRPPLGEPQPAASREPAASSGGGKRLSKAEGSTSLPDIHKVSGRSSMKMSPTGKSQMSMSPSSKQMTSPLQSKGAGLNLGSFQTGADGPPLSGPRPAWG